MAADGANEPVDPAVDAALDEISRFEESLSASPLTRAARALGRTRAFAVVYRTLMPKLDVRLARSTQGWVAARIKGFPELLLNTTGAKSGQPRTNPLLYIRDGRDFLVVGTNFGQPKHPGWTANLRATPRASIEVGPTTVPVTAEPVGPEDFDALFARFVEIYPGYANYLQRRGALPPRMFRLRPGA